jgi:uncharacterized protein involved in exopolysaccharide biosynthesis
LELTEAFQRVIGRHLILIACVVALGVAVPLWSHTSDKPRYEAKTRVMVETADPRNAEEAAAIADAARGIVTTEGFVAKALEDARAERDASRFGQSQVKVRAVGASGVLELSVVDTDPEVAAGVANSLAQQLIESRQRASEGGVPTLIASLDEKIAAVTKTIADIEAKSATVDPASALAGSLRLQHDRAVRDRSDLEVQRQQLLGQRAIQPSSSIIDRAERPTDRLPSGRIPDMVIGGLLGLALGVAGASVVEVLQPSLVGPEAISKVLGAPILGCLPCPPERVATSADHVIPHAVYREVREMTDHLNLAAAAAQVNVIRLESAGPNIDLERLGNWLGVGSLPLLGVAPRAREGFAVGTAVEPAADIDPFLVGVVLVLPRTIKRRDLDSLRHLLAMTHWPLLGIVAYREPRVAAAAFNLDSRRAIPTSVDTAAPNRVTAP